MWPSTLEVAKMNPFGTPYMTAKCQQGQYDLTQALVKNRHIAAASVQSGDSCEFGSNHYFMLCGLGGILSCGITHTMVTPLDLVKCRIQVDPAKYKSVFNGFRVTVAEDGTRGLVKGWAPTFFGYSIQGMFKFGLYEVFKVYYSALIGEEMSYEYRTTLYLISSASAEFFADIGLAPLEAAKVRIQTMPGYANNLRQAFPKMYGDEGLGSFYKGLVPLWLRQIPYTMMKFACFERTLELLYKYVVPKPRQECTKGEQLVVTFAAGYIAGVFCAIVSHPADSVVSKLNQERGASAIDVLKKLGMTGVWKGLGPRIVMIGTLTGAQWFIYDAVKVWLRMPRPPPPEMPESLILDGPRGSLRRLRSQLAEDGCPESQVVLAKQLLEERCDLDVDKEENAKLGVYWLTKASEQGNLEATDILRKCLATGRGITEHNYYDVKNCLDMTQDEKLARRAAREMFTSLSNGEDFITTEQLQRRMRDLESNSSNASCSGSHNVLHSNSQKDLNDSLNDKFPKNGLPEGSIPKKDEEKENDVHDWMDHRGEKLTEAALVSAAASYARGMLPIVSHALCMVDSSQMVLDTIPLLQRPLMHPFASLKRLYIWLIETLGQRGMSIKKILFTSNIHILLLLLLYSLFGTESLILFIPMALYYLSFVVMVIATFQMLQRKREFNNFRVWSGLFLSYSGGNLNPEEAEYQFCCNNLKPYGHFFLALLLNLMTYPIIAHQWTPQSEFTIIAVALTLVTLLNFVWKDSSKVPDLLALFSFGVHVLAKYPYETDIVVAQGWRFLDIRVPTFASYVVGNGIEFCLNFRAVFYLLIPAVFAKMAARDNWRGTYQTLIPHCVSLSWWQIAIFSSQGATWYGLIRGALALVGMVLFLPLAGLASVILPIVAAAKYLSESDLAMRIAVTALLGGMPFLASWYVKKTRAPKFNWIITLVQLFMGVGAGMFLSWPLIMEYKQESDGYEVISTLSWEQYQNHCHQPAWEELSSKAQVQIQCADLEGIFISWEGYVTNIKLKSIKNNIAVIFDKLPESVRNTASCMYGELYLNSCESSDQIRQENCKQFARIQKRKNKCHFPAWNRYEFEITVKMKSGMWGNNAEILLIADHSFTNFSLNIYPGDKIWFSGTLLNSGLEEESLLGGSEPHIGLEEIGCLACHSTHLKSQKRYNYHITFSSTLSDLYLGVKTVLNFLFNPIVMFK